MEHIQTWNISTNYTEEIIKDVSDNISHLTQIHLLDLTKSQYTLTEKYVYDTAMFHLKRMNIHDIENHYIEFWCKPKFETHCLHVDCDENLKKTNVYKYPLLSCVTYLCDNLECPTIITNVDLDCYKYKEFEKQTEIVLSIPTCNKQITFDGHFYHGSTTLSDGHDDKDRYIIAVNLWDTKPDNIDYYIPDDKHDLKFDSNPLLVINAHDTPISTLNVSCDVINYTFFNDLLYNRKKDTCYIFDNLINSTETDSSSNTFKITLDESIKENEKMVKLKNKFGDVINDFNAITDKTIELKYNRFLQRFVYPQIYCPDVCKFIINECEMHAKNNGGWTTTRHNKYPTTDLPVDAIPSIFGLVLETLKTITKKVSSSYELHDDMFINVEDLFVVKYSHDAQNALEMHHDGSFLSFSILLNDANEFEGGGTYFDDGLTTHLEQGGILIHSSRIKHSGLPITKGTRYLLVGFMNVDVYTR